MPELPEVETVRRGLEQKTLGLEIVGGEVLLKSTIAYPHSVGEFLGGLEGVAIARWHRRGKYLLAELRNLKDNTPGGWLGVHLRMTGQLLWLDKQEPVQKHTRVRLFLEKNLKNNSAETRELRFVDIRTFGKLWWVPPEVELSSIITGLKQLGPEPFSPEFSVEYLAKQLQKRQRPIKTALLDQGLVAGLGNIYADEVLFVSGIRPTVICKELTEQQIEALHPAIIEVLQKAIAAGGTTFSNFISLLGINGNYGGVAWVYKRGGQPCRVCDTLIERIKLGGRSTHFCPSCQL